MIKSYFPIIDRYVSRELFLTWLAVILVLMLIIMSGALARLLGRAAEGAIPSDVLLTLLGITALNSFVLLMPMSLFLGVLLCFSRLYKDNEMTAMSACGIGLKRLYRPLLMVAAPITLFIMLLTLYVLPWVSQQSQIMESKIENRSELTGLAAGRFNESQSRNAIMFLEKQSDDRLEMENVFIYQKEISGQNIETADLAKSYKDEHGRKFILFLNGQSYTGEPGRADYQIIQYEKHGVYIPESKHSDGPSADIEAMPSSKLWQSKLVDEQVEFQWRLSIPIATFLMALLALPLSYTTPRKGRYSKLALAILLYLIYSNLLGVARNWVEVGKVPVWPGMWWVHTFGVLLIFVWWILRAGGFKHVYLSLFAKQQSIKS